MDNLVEIMIAKNVQEESKIRKEKIVLQSKIAREKIHEANTLDLRLYFSYNNIDNEWFWRLIAYTYFICKTLGLSILIDYYIFKRPNITLFLFIFLCCYSVNLIFFKYVPKRKIKAAILKYLSVLRPRAILESILFFLSRRHTCPN
jgi:hypothetical protein